MSTKFLFPDWENEDDDSQDLCGRMREMAEEAARRERQGLPEKKPKFSCLPRTGSRSPMTKSWAATSPFPN